MKHQLTALVDHGKFKFENPELLKNLVKSYEGKRVILTIEKYINRRSYLQNAYYWGVVVELLYATFRNFGEDVSRETVHELLKAKFLPKTLTDKTSGEIIGTYSGSTAALATVEFMDYVADIQRWAAATFEINIPDPNVK